MLLSGRLGVVKLILRMHALLMLLQLTGAVTFGPRPKKNSGVVIAILVVSVMDSQRLLTLLNCLPASIASCM